MEEKSLESPNQNPGYDIEGELSAIDAYKDSVVNFDDKLGKKSNFSFC